MCKILIVKKERWMDAKKLLIFIEIETLPNCWANPNSYKLAIFFFFGQTITSSIIDESANSLQHQDEYTRKCITSSHINPYYLQYHAKEVLANHPCPKSPPKRMDDA